MEETTIRANSQGPTPCTWARNRYWQAQTNVPAATMGLSPNRAARAGTIGRMANRQRVIAASAVSTPGAGTPARSR